MAINKTQQFLYFQNKAKHYDIIKNMKPHVNDRLQKQFMKTLSYNKKLTSEISSPKNANKKMPHMQQYDIKQKNQCMINRLFQLMKSDRTEVKAQGNYSRYFNYDQRKFRTLNPYKNQLNRTIQISNKSQQKRLQKIAPRIGSSIQWDKHFDKTLDLKKNMSRYLLSENKSKASLHISVVHDYLPKYFQSFLNTDLVIQKDKKSNKSLPKQIEITQQGLLMLPNIKSKEPVHTIKHTKDHKKLIFDRSKTSLKDANNKSQSSLTENLSNNPEKGDQKSKQVKVNQRKQKRHLLQFKFNESNYKGQKTKNRSKKSDMKDSQIDSTLKNEKPGQISKQKQKQTKDEELIENERKQKQLTQESIKNGENISNK